MQSFIGFLVIVIQLAAAGFVIWGGWLCLSTWFRAEHPGARAPAAPVAASAKQEGFERVASLVLLALLCTALAALP